MKAKKNKRWTIKHQEDDSFKLSPHKSLPYRDGKTLDCIVIKKEDSLRHAIMEKIYNERAAEHKIPVFFETFRFQRGSVEYDLCVACWEIL